MEEELKLILPFPSYQISNFGRVETIKSQYPLSTSTNRQGHLKVNLRKNGLTHTRSVNHLVADAFLPEPERDDHTSVIHYDGNKANCHVQNLAWRPRHFAIRYHSQFHTEKYQEPTNPVWDMKTGEQYQNAQEASVKNGLLFTDILRSIYGNTYTWPTYQEFRFIN